MTTAPADIVRRLVTVDKLADDLFPSAYDDSHVNSRDANSYDTICSSSWHLTPLWRCRILDSDSETVHWASSPMSFR